MSDFDLPGALRRIRRRADLSQRQLAQACGVSHSAIAQAESGRRGLTVELLSRLAAVAGLRLALLDATGDEARPMTADSVRDGANRRFPAHLDTRYGDEDWWHTEHRHARDQPWYTFDRSRRARDRWRGRTDVPDDHLRPQPGDSPAERAAARQRAARRRRQEERQRRVAAGEVPPAPAFTCTCPAVCDELDDWTAKPVHADECPCRCDVG
ncbi:UNVERIFIED_ORG: XRE family transcriptional regulator [Bacillus sp. AZ43]